MHDQVGMRMSDCREHLEEEPEPGLHVQLLVIAVAINVVALDIFQDQIRLPRR